MKARSLTMDDKCQQCVVCQCTHYEPGSPMGYDNNIFVNFGFSKTFLAQIHPETSYFHMLCPKSFSFVIDCMIYMPKVALKSSFLSFELILLSKKPEARSK